MDNWTEKKPKKEKKTKKSEPKKPSRSATPPKKSNDQKAWHKWYEEEIRERIAEGHTLDKIKSDLNITHVDKFLNERK